MSEPAVDHVHHSIDYIEIPVMDVAGAKAFYSTAFGWEFRDYGPEYAGILIGGREVGGVTLAAATARGGPLVILYSAALEESLEKVRSAGGTVLVEPFDFPGGRRFHFADPADNELAVWSES